MHIITVFFFAIDVLNIYHTESLEMERQVKFKINATKMTLSYTSDLDYSTQTQC